MTESLRLVQESQGWESGDLDSTCNPEATVGLSFLICQTGTPLLPLTVWRLQELQDVITKAP